MSICPWLEMAMEYVFSRHGSVHFWFCAGIARYCARIARLCARFAPTFCSKNDVKQCESWLQTTILSDISTQSMHTFLTAPKSFATPCQSRSNTSPMNVGSWHQDVYICNPTPPTFAHHAKGLPMGIIKKTCLSVGCGGAPGFALTCV